MSRNSCDSCVDAGRERNRELDNLRAIAKTQALEENKPKAICKDEVNGLFIADVGIAISQHFLIQEVVSGLQ